MTNRLQELREARDDAEREYKLARRGRDHDEVVCAARALERADDRLADEERHVNMANGTKVEDTMDDVARVNGFENEVDLHRHVVRVDLSTPQKIAAFKTWQHDDGSKDGILKLLGEYVPQPYANLSNKAMARKLRAGDAIDLADFLQSDGTYLLPEGLVIEGKDLCDASQEAWMWSVGKSLTTGERRAARDARYYENEARGWKCEWLR